MTIEELIAARAAAGARYTAAVTELKASLIDLAALDRAFDNWCVSRGGPAHIRTFASIRENLGDLAHQEFAPAPLGRNWNDEVREATNAYVENFRG